VRRDLLESDGVVLTLGGVTHEFPHDAIKVQVDDTSAKGGTKYRYATVVIQLVAGEFPENTAHITGGH
jgi:hypothetical protein